MTSQEATEAASKDTERLRKSKVWAEMCDTGLLVSDSARGDSRPVSNNQYKPRIEIVVQRHSDVGTMEVGFNAKVRQLKLDSSVEFVAASNPGVFM